MNPILTKQKAFFSTNQTLSYGFRIEMLRKLKQAVIDRQDQIIKALYLDLNKGETEAILTEIWMVLKEINYLIRHLHGWMRKKTIPTHFTSLPGRSYYYYAPLGATLIVSPWNYPFQLTITPLAGAIAAGNTSIIKPSHSSINTESVLKELIASTFPEDYVACVAMDHDQTIELFEDDFDHIFFTGSEKIGRIVLQKSAKHLTKVTLELGGKSPCIVDDTFDLKVAARRIVFGKFVNAGQTCIAPDYLICSKKRAVDLAKALKDAIDASYPNGALNEPTYPKMITSRHFSRLANLLADQKLAFGGIVNPETLKIEPTVLITNPANPLMAEEIFGPVLPIITYEDESEIKEIISVSPSPLSLYVFSKDRKFIDRMLSSISFGGGCINDTLSHVVSDYLPFGGVKNSGHGNYHGFNSFVTFSHQVSIYQKSSRLELKLRYLPYSPLTKKFVRKVFLPKR